MTSQVFGTDYANQYDVLYRDKDYEAECNLLETVFARYGSENVSTILDLGCGTGNHAWPLARRGFKVTGVDRSEEMLARATAKAATNRSQPHPTFHHADLCSLSLEPQFDAVLMMFAVLGYQLTNDAVLQALAVACRHLHPGGLFICDVWYGPCVLKVRPGDRVKEIPYQDGRVLRAASGRLDTFRHVCEVSYKVWQLQQDKLVAESTETHQMRYFFPQEIELLMRSSGLQLLDIRAFEDLDRLPDDDTWNVMIVARRQQ